VSEPTPIIDIPEALNRSMGDVDFLKMMLEEFQHMIPAYVDRIGHAVQSADMENLGKDAHQFKGTAANLGAKAIALCALELEQIGKQGSPDGGRAAFERLVQAVATFEQYYAQIDWSAVGP
jgi:two-component system, sensor histidine kinase and response regulator